MSLAAGAVLGCGDATPNVVFLEPIIFENKIPQVSGTSNLTPTQELAGTGIRVKGRVSYVGLQNTIYGANVKIIGKIAQ